MPALRAAQVVVAMTLPEPYVTTEALKDRIRSCTTLAQVDAAARAMAAEVAAHEPHDRGGIIQLRNLVAYQRMSIDRGWLDEVVA